MRHKDERNAPVQFSYDVEEALEDLGVGIRDFARLLSSKYGFEFDKAYSYIYQLIDSAKAATPRSQYFFVTCEELGLEPRKYFSGDPAMMKIIKRWEEARK